MATATARVIDDVANRGAILIIPTGVPVNAKARVVAISDILALRNMGEMLGTGLSVSPDGKSVAFELHQADVPNDTYRVAWFVASTALGRAAINVGDGGDPTLFMSAQGSWISSKPTWSSDSEWIAYLRKDEEAVQIWRSRRDGSAQEQLTHNAADAQSLAWSRDGKRIYFKTDAPRERIEAAERLEAAEGYRVDDKEFHAFYEPRPLHPPYRLFRGEPKMWTYDIEKRLERESTSEELAEYESLIKSAELPANPAARGPAFERNSGKAAWLENRQPEIYAGLLAPLTVFVSHTPDGSRAVACPAEECTGRIQGLSWNGEDQLVFERVNSGLWSLYLWSLTSGRVERVLQTHHWMSDCTVTGGRAICFSEGPATPRRIVAVKLTTGNVETLVDPNPEWARIKLGEVERLEWKNKSGLSSWGYLVKPINYTAGKRYPLVIVQYDARMCLRGGTGDEFPTHLFAARGIAVLCTSGTGGDPELVKKIADPVALFRAEYKDFAKHRQALDSLETIIGLLAERGIVDSKRVGITGLSAGVETLQYALIHSRAFAAAATSGGGMEPMSYYGSTRQSREQIYDPIGFGDFAQGKGESWREFSLSLNVDRINVPLLIQAADREYLHAMQTAVTWKVHDKQIEMFVFPDERHVKWHPAHRYRVYTRNVDWFAFWLQRAEDPDPAKADQYARWRQLPAQHTRQ